MKSSASFSISMRSYCRKADPWSGLLFPISSVIYIVNPSNLDSNGMFNINSRRPIKLNVMIRP